MAPITRIRMRKPMMIEAGRPTKNTCICGIRRASTPSPRLNRRPNTMNGAEKWNLAGLEQGVAVVERRDHQVMQIGGKHQREAEHGQEIRDDHTLLALR